MIDARAADGAGSARGAAPLVLVDTSAWVWHARFGDALLDQIIAEQSAAFYTLDRRMRDAARRLGVPVIAPSDSGR